jgi:hypothetical protein
MPRKSRTNTRWSIPQDAVLLESRDGWMIYHSPAEGRLYIYPGDYHAEALPLKPEDLSRWLARLSEAIVIAGGVESSEEPDVPH